MNPFQRFATALLLPGCLLCIPWTALARSQPDTDPLPDLLQAARSHHAGLQQARAALKAALARVPQAAALPDPELVLEYMGNRSPGSAQGVRMAQAFPWPGTLARRRDAASFQVRVLWHEVQDLELQVAAQMRTLCTRLAYLDREQALVRRNLDLYRKQMAFIEQQVRSGGRVADLLRIEMEAGLLADNLARLDEAMGRDLAAIESLTGSLPPPDLIARLTLGEPVPHDPALPEPSREDLRERHPMLQAMATRVDAARNGIPLARLETRPEFMLGAGYRSAIDPAMSMGGQREFMNEAVAMVSVRIPLWQSRNRAVRAEAAALLDAALHEQEAAARALAAELEAVLSRRRDAARQVTLFGDQLLPKARQAQDAIEAGYRSGDASLLDLLDARRRLLETETAYWRAVADQHINQAGLDAMFGTPGTPSLP